MPVAPASTALVPLAVAPVAPAVPTPPKVRGAHAIACVAVRVVDPTAVRVKVVDTAEVWVKAPVTVPLVNGVVRFVGELVPSVFVIAALAGVAVYEAENEGLVTVAPISTVPQAPQLNPVMLKPGRISSWVSWRGVEVEVESPMATYPTFQLPAVATVEVPEKYPPPPDAVQVPVAGLRALPGVLHPVPPVSNPFISANTAAVGGALVLYLGIPVKGEIPPNAVLLPAPA